MTNYKQPNGNITAKIYSIPLELSHTFNTEARITMQS